MFTTSGFVKIPFLASLALTRGKFVVNTFQTQSIKHIPHSGTVEKDQHPDFDSSGGSAAQADNEPGSSISEKNALQT
jgi:hypothetical protein